MGEIEMVLLKQKLKLQEDMIANLENHVKALQVIIEKQHSCIDHLLRLNFGGDLDG